MIFFLLLYIYILCIFYIHCNKFSADMMSLFTMYIFLKSNFEEKNNKTNKQHSIAFFSIKNSVSSIFFKFR